jgi:2,4-dienoyl-CoA reductase-like NADH-dependent reductase (Old Yellow Enzyme family)
MTNQKQSVLFSPIQLDGVTIPNRIAMAPMTRSRSPDGIPGADVVEYYARRARGGAGLIITEGMAVNPAGARQGAIPLFFQDATVEACAKITQAVHDAASKIFVQLWHVGIQELSTDVNPGVPTISEDIRRVGPSGLSGAGLAAGDGMDLATIKDTIADYARATVRAKQAGFDGVEIHGAHGYLPDQFLWARTNRRSDEYGGALANRVRFPAEIIRSCRAAVGPDFPIMYRFSQWKHMDYAAKIADTPEELGVILKALADAGATGFHCSTRRYWEPAFPPDPTSLGVWARRLGGRPVIAVGSISLEKDSKDGITEKTGGVAASGVNAGDVDVIAGYIERGEFDMIALGRAMISNPNWASLVQRRQLDQLRPFRKDDLADFI